MQGSYGPTSQSSPRRAGRDVLSRPDGGSHVVQFYDDEEHLCEVAAGYLGAALREREGVVVISSERTRGAIGERLRRMGHDVEGAARAGSLAFLDARQTLSRFMRGDMPDRDRFLEVVGGVVDRSAASAGAAVRAYGDMVDLLWREGRSRATIHLEELWNELLASRPFSLLCGYAMSHFHEEAHARALRQVCDAHTHVLPAESYGDGADLDARLREVAFLQQRARALETEVAMRGELEVALRVALADLGRSEQALRENQLELEDFAENAPEGLDRIGPDGTVLWANKAELELLGYAADEYVGHHVAEFHVDPEVIDDVLTRLRRNETVRNREARLRARDGSIREVLVSANALTRDGHFVHGRCFTKDITAQRALERAAQASAREADRRKDEFLAMLGHELRNPLAPILTGLQLMRLRGVGSDRERDVIERQVQYLVRLVDDLLDVSRITRGKVRLEKEPVELAAVIARALEVAMPLYEQRSHALSVEVAREGLLVEADPVRLAQVFANLLTNAAKYTDPGGRIAVQARRDGGRVVVSVRDSGMGIAREMLPTVFDMFVQGERGLDRSQGGLGIGLTVARTLVELHGGTIAAHSAGLGRGSEFVVALPAAAPAPRRPAEAPPSPAATRASLRILIVDDNGDAAEILAEALRGLGHEVAVAHDGAEALSIAPSWRPEAAILDIGLPAMDGYELARNLTELLDPPPRLIAMSGYGQEGDQSRSREAGFEVHLVKPVDLGDVAALFAGPGREAAPASAPLERGAVSRGDATAASTSSRPG